MTERHDDRLGKAATALSYNFDVWGNELIDRVTHIVMESENRQAIQLAAFEDRLNTRLELQDSVLTAIRIELSGGVKEMQVGFETVVERQFIKEQMMRKLTAQLRDLAIQMERAQIAGEPPSPEVVRDMYQVSAKLQEVAAA